MEFVVPTFPGVPQTLNGQVVNGMLIMSGEIQGAFTDPSVRTPQVNVEYAKLVYDFLHDPVAMASRRAWSANTLNHNLGCVPESPNCYLPTAMTISPAVPAAIAAGGTASYSVSGGTLVSTTYPFSQTNTSVTSPDDALGAPDAAVATFNASTDQLNLDFGSTFPVGASAVARMSVATAGSVTATLSFSTDNITYTNPTAVTVNSTTLTDYTVALPVAARYIRITRAGTTPVLNVDAVALQTSTVPAYTWAIAPTTGVSSSSGTGTSTGTVTFAQAGTYTVTFTVSNTALPSGCANPGISTVSATQVVNCVTPSAPTVTTTAASCSAAGGATVSNYNVANTYAFTPSGPTVGAGGVISGLVPGTSYTVTASTGVGCVSAPSASFSVAAKWPAPVLNTN
jgi:hypothetical protein